MGLQFVKLDAVAKEIVERLNGQVGRTSGSATDSEDEPLKRFSLAPLPSPLLAPSGPVVGIDLGTVNSCVAIVQRAPPGSS